MGCINQSFCTLTKQVMGYTFTKGNSIFTSHISKWHRVACRKSLLAVNAQHRAFKDQAAIFKSGVCTYRCKTTSLKCEQ